MAVNGIIVVMVQLSVLGDVRRMLLTAKTPRKDTGQSTFADTIELQLDAGNLAADPLELRELEMQKRHC
jgi:hypothetical protein